VESAVEIAVTPRIRIEGLSKTFGFVVALEPTSLSMNAGEFLTLLGPSGSGKTTLLQMICGLIEPTAGRIYIDGKDETATPVHKRGLGLVFQHYALFPHLTVSENIGFPLQMRGLSKGEIDAGVNDALQMVKLDHLAERFPAELSGGQQQRVALARCFIYKPSIILMDEPLGALDKKLRELMQLEIKRLHRETAATIIYVTHDQEEALALSDRICLMNHARIEQIDAPRKIYAQPRTVFAAEFIGLSNILKGKVKRGPDGTTYLDTPYGALTATLTDLTPGTEAALLVRPEKLSLDSNAENILRGRVTEIVYVGSETRTMVEIAPGMVLTVRSASEAPKLALGQEVCVGWAADSGVLIR
jgi:putative spermidine/putrescine transport system ATP-binding protein